MRGAEFDRVTRAISLSTSRRGVLKAVLGGLVAGGEPPASLHLTALEAEVPDPSGTSGGRLVKHLVGVLVVVLGLTVTGIATGWPDRGAVRGSAGAEAPSAAQQTEMVSLTTQATGSLGSSRGNCPDDNSLCAMLADVPDVLSRGLVPWPIATYANVAAQLDALDAPAPATIGDDGTERWLHALEGLTVFGRAALGTWPDDYFGFRFQDIDESLMVGSTDFPQSILLRGRFERGLLVDSWRRAGYSAFPIGDRMAWSIRGDFEVDLTSPAKFAGAAVNYVTILEDGLIAFTSTRASMADVLGAARDGSPSLADRPDVGLLLGSIAPTLAAAYLSTGAAIGSSARLVVLGLTPGGPMHRYRDLRTGTPYPDNPGAPDMRCQIALLYPDGTDAKAVAEEIIENLDTMDSLGAHRPYAEWFPERSVVAVSDHPVVVAELGSGDRPLGPLVVDLFARRDLVFLI